MIGTKRNGSAPDPLRQAADLVRPVAAQTVAQVKPVAAQVAAQVKPVAAQVKPVAKSAGAATRRGVHRTRVWAAPQLERSGQVLEDTVAPKVSAVLSAAAQRIEPVKARRPRWPKVVGLSILAAASAAAAAAILRRRAQPGLWTPTADAAPDSTPSAAETPDSPATSTEAQGNNQVRTP